MSKYKSVLLLVTLLYTESPMPLLPIHLHPHNWWEPLKLGLCYIKESINHEILISSYKGATVRHSAMLLTPCV